jgi:hypothetical protein
VLGKGSFGKVMLVKRKGDDSQTLYAMKVRVHSHGVKVPSLDASPLPHT